MGLELSGDEGGCEDMGLWEMILRPLAAVPGAGMSLQRRSSSLGAETGDTRGCMGNCCWELVFLDVSAEEADCSGLVLKM